MTVVIATAAVFLACSHFQQLARALARLGLKAKTGL